MLYQHFFWFYSHPAVYIMILPAMGVISEVDLHLQPPAHLRLQLHRPLLRRHRAARLHRLGPPPVRQRPVAPGQPIFSLLTFSVAIPSAIKVFNWTATLYKGDIRLKTPLLYAAGFIMLFTIGGLTGLFLGALSVDIHLTDTYFVVAHFHYVMVGSMLFAFLGGMYYWWPKMFGKMYHEKHRPKSRAASSSSAST